MGSMFVQRGGFTQRAAAKAKDCWSPKHLHLCHHSKVPACTRARRGRRSILASARARVCHGVGDSLLCSGLPESFVRRPGPRQPVSKARHVLWSACPRAGPRPAHDEAETSRLSPFPVYVCPGLRKNWFVWYVLADQMRSDGAHPCDGSPRSLPKPYSARY